MGTFGSKITQFKFYESPPRGRGGRECGIRDTHVIALASLPDIHADPFDRILIAQAVVENLPLVSKDENIAEYGIPVIW